MRRYWPPLIGATLGIAVTGYAIIYLPMKANYERGGCVWLECGVRKESGE